MPKIIRGEELARKGFGGIYGVGKAAEVPPALAVLSHTPDGAHTTVAWVGKGIVYDTGGLSIKGKVGKMSFKMLQNVHNIRFFSFSDCYAGNETGLWWCSWNSWCFLCGC